MKLLLDSHIWIWSAESDDRLSPAIATILEEAGNEIWLSVATFWEIMMLGQKKRMNLLPKPEVWIQNALDNRIFHEAPITREIAVTSRSIQLGTEDPVDRFLVATAMVHNLTLVTADAHLLACDLIHTLANRIP